MITGMPWPRRVDRTYGGALPLLLAALARLCTDGAPASAHPAPLAWLLVLGPIQETMLLMCAATLMRRHMPGPPLAPVTLTALIAASFVLAHGLQYGHHDGLTALASLPMAWVLSEAAARAASLPGATAQLCGAARLTALHALYNAGLCWLPW